MFIFPISFYVVIAILVYGVYWSLTHLRQGTGIPTLAVLTTVGFWYVGDAFYNDYAGYYMEAFTSATRDSAWWQVAWFLIVFLTMGRVVHRWYNARYLNRGSGVLQMFKHGVEDPSFQIQLNMLFRVCVMVYLAVSVWAAIRLQADVIYFFFPFWGYKAEPWGRGQFGSGYDSLLTVAFYFQMLATSIFGVVAALATDRRVRSLAMICCLISWPYFIFDRTRNSLLAVVMPGILSWCILRLRGSVLKKAMALALCFFVINTWMKFIISNRTGMSIAAALQQKGLHLGEEEKVHHEGLNMYEELCWINTFLARGTYHPNWGMRYFEDAVNPIPRVLWPGKPAIGFDYAILRGQNMQDNGQVTATISTGLIGQGVVNFGTFLGPAAAALIMCFWSAMVARLDLTAQQFGRLPLFAIGLFVTFNVGRDFCFLALYPFMFGTLAIWLYVRNHPELQRLQQARVSMRGARPGMIRGPRPVGRRPFMGRRQTGRVALHPAFRKRQ